MNALDNQIEDFRIWALDNGIDIDCSDTDSQDCSTVLTATEKAQYDAEWDNVISAAETAYYTDNETNADTEELACYQNIFTYLHVTAN